jgi:ABC-type amino acid transport substrate-binding protein
MRKTIVAVLLALLAIPAYADDGSAYDRVIAKNEIVCGITPWAPYKEIDPVTKEWKGFVIDLYRKMFATLDMKVTFKEVVLGTQVEDLNLGRVDAICDDGPWTLSAGKFVEFADPVYAVPDYIYVRKDETRFKSRAELNNKDVKFAGIDGDVSNDLAKRLFPNATLLSMPGNTGVSQIFLNVTTKKADVAIVDRSSYEAFSKNNPDQLKLLFPEKPVGVYKVTVSVKKGDFKLLGLVNQAIDNGLSFGIVDEILDGVDPKHQTLIRVRSKYAYQ